MSIDRVPTPTQVGTRVRLHACRPPQRMLRAQRPRVLLCLMCRESPAVACGGSLTRVSPVFSVTTSPPSIRLATPRSSTTSASLGIVAIESFLVMTVLALPSRRQVLLRPSRLTHAPLHRALRAAVRFECVSRVTRSRLSRCSLLVACVYVHVHAAARCSAIPAVPGSRLFAFAREAVCAECLL